MPTGEGPQLALFYAEYVLRPGVVLLRDADVRQDADVVPQEPFAGGGLVPQNDGTLRIRAAGL